MLNIKMNFYLESDKNIPIKTFEYDFGKLELELFNQMYAEGLLYRLDIHFEMYEESRGNHFRLGSVGNFSSQAGIQVMDKKKRLSAISGNTGESLVIPTLNSLLNTDLNYCRISFGKKCPDYKISITSELLKLWDINKASIKTQVPLDIPLEVKSHWSNDNGYPKKALEQLVSYWITMFENGFPDCVGVGIVVRVNLKPDDRNMKYFLFLPKDTSSLEELKDICRSNDTLKRKTEIIQERDLFL